LSPFAAVEVAEMVAEAKDAGMEDDMEKPIFTLNGPAARGHFMPCHVTSPKPSGSLNVFASQMLPL
jgi:hypothetical protein